MIGLGLHVAQREANANTGKLLIEAVKLTHIKLAESSANTFDCCLRARPNELHRGKEVAVGGHA